MTSGKVTKTEQNQNEFRARSEFPTKSPIFIIDDDEMFADCIKKTIKKVDKNLEVIMFKNIIDAMNSLDENLPSLIFLDILLPGPDGFTFLNEIMSYPDTSKIPIILITSLNLEKIDLIVYGIKGILKKDKMKPEEIKVYVERYTN